MIKTQKSEEHLYKKFIAMLNKTLQIIKVKNITLVTACSRSQPKRV